MRASCILIYLLGLVCPVDAQDTGSRTLQDLIGTWDVYMVDGKDIIGEFSASFLGKGPALQTRFVMPAMKSEVNGVWAYDAEVKSIVVFEVNNSGRVRSYTSNFKKPDELWFDGYSKQKPEELIEQSSLTWLSAEKIQVWAKDIKGGLEVKMQMVKRK